MGRQGDPRSSQFYLSLEHLGPSPMALGCRSAVVCVVLNAVVGKARFVEGTSPLGLGEPPSLVSVHGATNENDAWHGLTLGDEAQGPLVFGSGCNLVVGTSADQRPPDGRITR